MATSIDAIGQQVAVVKQDFHPLQQNFNDIATGIQDLQSSHEGAQQGILKMEETMAPIQLLPSVEQDVKSLGAVMQEVRESVMQLNEQIGRTPDLSPKRATASPSNLYPYANEATLRLCQRPSILYDVCEGLIASREHPYSNTPRPKSPWASYFCDCGPFYKIGRAISMTFSASRGAGGFSLSPVFAVANFVRRSQSPAFQLFNDAYKLRHAVLAGKHNLTQSMDIWFRGQSNHSDWDIERLAVYLEEMPLKLFTLFANKQASVYDRDQRGGTLLHDITFLALDLGPLQFQLIKPIEKLAAFIIDCGVDTTASVERMFSYNMASQDALSLAVSPFIKRGPSSKLQSLSEPHISQILLHYGCQFTSVDPNWKIGYQSSIIAACHIFPDLAIGCSPLALAVINRCETEVHLAHTSSRAPTALQLSVGWLKGMKMLLDAGALPDYAFSQAIRMDDVDAVRMLFEYNCSAPPGILWSSDNEEMQNLLFQHFLQQRNRLRDLALKTLPKSRQDALMLSSEEVLDTAAIPVFRELVSLYGRDNVILKGLHPGYGSLGGRSEVYDGYHVKPRLAERLHSAGFHCIDEMNRYGKTPIMKCLRHYSACWETILWYLEKGACPNYQAPNPHSTALHIVHWDLPGLGRTAVLKRLNSICNLYILDECECYCSSFGCSVVQSHLGRWGVEWVKNWSGSQNSLKEWLMENSIPWMTEYYHFELCRSEVFERLGMKHTCNHMYPRDPSDDEAAEIRSEESELHEQLEVILQAYKRARINFSGPFFDFWSDWWSRLNDILPELPRVRFGNWTGEFSSAGGEEEDFMVILERIFGHDEDLFEDTGLPEFFECVEDWGDCKKIA
ncbi:hypothetical protein AOQ84DRAFT_382653 [Glonium stellatum]|uniref:Uncharacterized protein n=1 Tax=Glonium stellatum TaxID=574774 RepID=A0A8E2JMD9_9PEZI|nr:hypothetical protein AOQ84DRAFT_382653 [Glonium stellatum]